MPSPPDTAAAIKETILSMAPGEAPRDPNSDPRLIEDLGYDSLGLMEMVVTLEEEFEVELLDQEAIGDIRRVNELQQYVLDRLNAPT